MTTEQLIDGVVGAIYKEFGESYPIYTENNEQGMDEPCFLVTAINPQKNRFLGRRYRRTVTLNVNYFPTSPAKVTDESAARKEMNDAAERLFDCLEIITANGHKIKGFNQGYTVSDGVLVYTLDFDYYEIEKVEVPIMQSLDLKGKLK